MSPTLHPRASSESAESETTKKARLDSAITLHSSSENSGPFSGTLTRPGSSKVADYNIKANFHKNLDVGALSVSFNCRLDFIDFTSKVSWCKVVVAHRANVGTSVLTLLLSH
jgi:hypothetical protein